jgi:branched-chain amino acid transport system permease protein
VELFIEYSLVGLAAGGIYALIALGFVVIFKSTGVFNFAMGEMMMIGGYLFYTAASFAGLHLTIALALALVGSMALGMGLERTVLRPMLGQPMIALVMVTVGVGAILKGLAGVAWGPDIKTLPELLPRAPLALGEMLIPGKIAWGFVLALAVVGAFIAYFQLSRGGIALRATASSEVNAYSMGINVPRVYGVVWGLAGVVGTVGGITLGSINGVTPNLGDAALVALAVVILGGLDSLAGVIVAGLAMGLIESLTGAYLGGKFREIVPAVAVLAVLMLRPHGLFGKRHVERI